MPLAAAIAVTPLVARRSVAKRAPTAVVAARVLLVLYVGWIVGETLFPLPLDGDALRDTGGSRRSGVTLMPLTSIRDSLSLGWGWAAVRLLAGNVLVFVPFGVLLPAVGSRCASLPRVALAGLGFSLSIEFGQFAVSQALGHPYRIAETDDVILNVAGVLAGFAIWRAAHGWPRKPGGKAARCRRGG
jgi:glycopeptide antibiotics resistance protein